MHTTVLCHASFPWSHDELTTSTSSSGNAPSYRLPSRAKIKPLNPHHRHRPPSPDRPTLTLHCYKKVISTLATLPTTQPHLHFASSLARALHHQSSICRYHSLSLPSHIHHPSTQWHSWWWTSRPSFCFLNNLSTCEFMWKYIFEISQHRARLSTSLYYKLAMRRFT
jgi:hypothetical protein